MKGEASVLRQKKKRVKNKRKKEKEDKSNVLRGGLVSIHTIKPIHLKALPAEPSMRL